MWRVMCVSVCVCMPMCVYIMDSVHAGGNMRVCVCAQACTHVCMYQVLSTCCMYNYHGE